MYLLSFFITQVKNIYGHLTLKEIFTRLADEPNRGLYEFFFNKYYPKLIWFAMLYVKQHSAAEEIVSDVLLNLFNRLSKIAESQNLEGYIFIAVKNQSLKYLRKSNRITYLENFESDEDLMLTTPVNPELIYIENEFYQFIREAIESLPPKRKLVFRMVKEEGLRYQDVAELLDISIKTVETHMGLALRVIHQTIQDYNKSVKMAAPIMATR